MTDQVSRSSLDFNRVAPVFVLVFVDVLGLTIILPLLHLYGATFGATPFQIGIVAAAFPLAQLIGVPLMGALSDRFGRKPLLLISQITTCLSFLMLGLAQSLTMVIVSRLVDGLFGANIATAQAALSDLTDEHTRTQGLGLTGAAFGLGFIFGPILSLFALEASDSLAVPALSAALYSFLSILFTLFFFKETLPVDKRNRALQPRFSPFIVARYLARPQVNGLLLLMFAQQVIFFGFEALLGLFLLSRLGLLGGGTAIIFLISGLVLVMVQGRMIGKWSKRFGERKLIIAALLLLGISLLLLAFTPQQPHIFYVRDLALVDLAEQGMDSTEAIIGNLNISLPPDSGRGWMGILWVIGALVPLSIGAGLMRPSLNSLLTQRVRSEEYGSILGVSSSFVSAANASAPLLGGYLFQQYGATMPFLVGGAIMLLLFLLSWGLLRQ